jgi:hypothetical protein
LQEAIGEYEAALRNNADDAGTRNNLGLALAQMTGRLPDAIAQFQAALRLQPDFASITPRRPFRLFPARPVPPTIEWRDADPRAKGSGSSNSRFTDGAAPVRVKSPGPRLQPGPIDERCAKAGAVTPKLTPNQEAGHAWKAGRRPPGTRSRNTAFAAGHGALLGYEDEKSKKPVSSGETTCSISRDPVGAPVFYRDVPLIPVPEGERGVIAPLPPEAVPLIAWRLMDLSTGRSRVMMEGLPTCANCHSFSRDGKWMGIDVDGPQNDKGLYALVPVRKEPRSATTT